ncbi:MAG: DivIVA domain-containing protein [Clostridia bacterium]|nr:DivIVA domain-containing protein [Clostridia bacterium]
MLLSEKLEQAKFSKSVAGYSVKEVDGFLGDFLPILREEEELMRVLRTKLSAFEAHIEEIEKREKEAYRVLEAAKEEAGNMLAAAKRNADTLVAEAKAAAALREQAAEARAAEQIDTAERRAAARLEEAKQNAEMILAAADRKGRTMLAEASSKATAQNQSTKALAAECIAFEARFRTLVADTVRALAALKDDAPKPMTVPTAPAPAPIEASAETVHVSEPTAPRRTVQPTAIPVQPQEAVPETADTTAAQDIAFAGGQPVSAYTAETERAPKRRLYDTVNVTYEEDDGFSDIQRLMDDADGKKKTNPAHFME